jgi:hypothetical protein
MTTKPFGIEASRAYKLGFGYGWLAGFVFGVIFAYIIGS